MRRLFSSLFFLFSDLLMLFCAFLLAFWTRTAVLPTLGLLPQGFFSLTHFGHLSYVLLVFILVFSYERLYSEPLDPYEEFLHLIRGLMLSVVLIAVFIYFSGQIKVFARTILFLIPLWGLLLLPFGRWLTRKLLAHGGFYRRLCAVVGQGMAVSRFLVDEGALEQRGFRLVGWFGDEDAGVPLSRLGGWADLEQVLDREKIDSLFIVADGIGEEEMGRLINRIEPRVAELRIVPQMGPMHGLSTEIEYLGDQLMIKNRNNLFSVWNRLSKRFFDLVISLVLLFVFGLPLLLVGLAVQLDSRGGVFFSQDRFGRGGKTFRLLKFRTMYLDNEARLERFFQENPQCRSEWQEFKKIKSKPDPRVTRVGYWLRRFSIDEFPQIWQVFIGQMSLVGPRPYLIREQEEIRDAVSIIFRVKSGLTGLWQIRGRNELPFRERIRLDEYYVRNWSFSLDILILLKTFMVVLKGKGAY